MRLAFVLAVACLGAVSGPGKSSDEGAVSSFRVSQYSDEDEKPGGSRIDRDSSDRDTPRPTAPPVDDGLELDLMRGQALDSPPPPLARRPGTPAPVVNACRVSITAAARDLNPIHVDAVSAGRAVRGADDVLRAPLEVQIIYPRGSGQEVRQSLIECQVDRNGRVVALQSVPGSAGDRPSETDTARRDDMPVVTGSVPPPRADGGEVVEAFYRALGAGDGEAASRYVVPEKQVEGPLSAGEITRYFGGLSLPLRAQQIVRAGAAQFDVRYSYGIGQRSCAGSARVTLTIRVGTTYIESIRAEEQCS